MDNNTFSQAQSIVEGMLDQLRHIEHSVFEHEEDMEKHMTHMLFYSAARLYGEEFAEDLKGLADDAVKMALEHEAEEVEAKKSGMPGQNAPSTVAIN